MQSKVRIQAYDENNHRVSDRLIDQRAEFLNGPTYEKTGKTVLEVTLENQEDIDNLISYLQRSEKPIKDKKPRGAPRKIKDDMNINKGKVVADKSDILETFSKSVLKKLTTQEHLIELLKSQGFMFITSDMIKENPQFKREFKLIDKHLKYQFMVRIVKAAKDPKNDKYDTRLAFAIKIYGVRISKLKVYLNGKFKQSVDLAWTTPKKINFKKPEKLLQFPQYMSYEDRGKWRYEWRKVMTNPDHEKSGFYINHEPFVKVY